MRSLLLPALVVFLSGAACAAEPPADPNEAVRKVAELICHTGHFPKPYAWREACDSTYGSNL